MTDEELVQKAEKFADDNAITSYYGECTTDEQVEEGRRYYAITHHALKLGYIAGAKDNAPQWHYPSKGELPGKLRVICLTKYWDIWIGERIEENTKQYKWKLFTDKFEEYYEDDEIIAWQYLPEPPKEV